MYNRLFDLPLVPKHSVLLFGPRGTGKSFWIREQLKDVILFDLLNSDTYYALLTDPASIQTKIPPNHSGWIVIDEIQRIPDLLNEAHRLIESKGYHFLLTGSSARKLKTQAANLLAGRARQHMMHPFTATELGDAFSLSHALQYGLLPEAVLCDDPKDYLHAYIHTYLQEEVLQEGILRNIGAFARFLEVASLSQGEILNYTAIGREAGIHRKVVANYFDITYDLLLGTKLPVFTKHAQRQLVAHPKFYLFDVGVYRSLRPKGPLDSPERIEGHALETLVLQHLRAYNDYAKLGYQFYYWRTRAGAEIDFIAYGEHGLIAIEVKRKRRLQGKDLRALRQFQEDYPMAQLYCFFGGDMPEYHDHITALPIETGLKQLPDILSGAVNIS